MKKIVIIKILLMIFFLGCSDSAELDEYTSKKEYTEKCGSFECGVVDGFDCGGCPDGTTCGTESHMCEQPCTNMDCGTDNGVECGSCQDAQECISNKCFSHCEEGMCGRTVYGEDCGPCEGNYYCDTTFNKCEQACVNWSCGMDHEVNCGECVSGETCTYSHTCVNAVFNDSGSGLQWQNYDIDSFVTFEKAVAYCENLELGSYSNWRLPSIEELRSLVRGCDKTFTGGTCNIQNHCTETSSGCSVSCFGCSSGEGPDENYLYWPTELNLPSMYKYWSSTLYDGERKAWTMDFENAGIYAYKVSNTSPSALCVRDLNSF